MMENMYLARSLDDEIRSEAEYGGAVTALLKYVLEEDEADAVLTVQARNENRYDVSPVLIDDPSELVKTAGAMHCVSPNIPRYLKEYCGGAFDHRIAVVGKPCDLKGIIEMAKRRAVSVDNLLLIGLNCTGTVSESIARKMFKEEFEVDPSDVIREEIEPEENRIMIKLKDGTEKERNLEELEEQGYGRRENCRRCDVNIPRMADIACGKWGVEKEDTTFIEIFSEKGQDLLNNAASQDYIEIEKPEEKAIETRKEKDEAAFNKALKWQEKDFSEIEEMDPNERFDYWMDSFENCIKCFSCRDACPICYCKDCILEVHNGMVPGGGLLPPEFSFNMIRTSHVIDSCVNCGQCQDVCPAEIPLARLNFMLGKKMQDIFGYEPGVDAEEKPPMTYSFDEELKIEEVEIDFSKLKEET